MGWVCLGDAIFIFPINTKSQLHKIMITQSKYLLMPAFFLATTPAFAATYRTRANETEFAVVGDAGNAADTGGTVGRGAVDYTYSIGKHEVTNAQYVNFLNAVGTSSVTADSH